MIENDKPEIILCEARSEIAYIQELGRLLDRSNSVSYAAAFFLRQIGLILLPFFAKLIRNNTSQAYVCNFAVMLTRRGFLFCI